MQLIECNLSHLGQLEPSKLPETLSLSKPIEINGVEISQNLLEELRILGLPLSFYSPGELASAKLAVIFDNNLIDDKNGLGFKDKLTLTHQEKLLQERSGEGEKKRH